MNPDAAQIWKAPRWALAVLLAMLGMLGPFSIDTYLPAFAAIAGSLHATPVEMQQTLSAYLFGFAFMNLFHGALSDSFGRRPVILAGLVLFTLASVGCALSQTAEHLIFFRALQGLSTGAGVVVSRAVIRDMFPPADAQRGAFQRFFASGCISKGKTGEEQVARGKRPVQPKAWRRNGLDGRIAYTTHATICAVWRKPVLSHATTLVRP